MMAGFPKGSGRADWGFGVLSCGSFVGSGSGGFGCLIWGLSLRAEVEPDFSFLTGGHIHCYLVPPCSLLSEFLPFQFSFDRQSF